MKHHISELSLTATGEIVSGGEYVPGLKMTNEERIEFIITNANSLVAQLRELSALQERIRLAQKALSPRTLAPETEVIEVDATEYH